MDHGGMDHGGHGGMEHGGHGGMDHGDMSSCKMNMVWNWDTTGICILTSSWRITTPMSLYVSLTFIAFSALLYEWLRLYIRRLDARLARSTSPSTPTHRRRASLLPTSNPGSASSSSSGAGGIADRRSISNSKRRSASSSSSSVLGLDKQGGRQKWIKPLETSRRTQMWRSALYATSIGMSFVLMLISMTFNAYVIAAIVVGAGLGHYWFNRDLSSTMLAGSADDKGLACHM
ncbi:related to CTR2-Protein involved in copper transport [Sporisorium reilianum f. sp. reilianum]|uniref:Copper transport protein n=1 Tax=Sporisorium reilianum f. sp. reilianum TaxID=72559 RepID=A0A2N8UER8_9BASI|nr:related to CTR2-Protein involved in copper transport [Sporisorium reilianum f. sp. reilianum]